MKIFAAKVFDPYTLDFLLDQVISIDEDTGLIVNVESLQSSAIDLSDPNVVNLSGHTVLPGFVDTHVHCELKYIYIP